jgi:uncharacterized protein (TIGR02646 family)
MIKLQKTGEPQELSQNRQRWDADLTAAILAGTQTSYRKSRYNHPSIKQALVNETHGKCAYCESKLLHIHHGDIEHVHPKSLSPEKTFEWNNLTLSCEKCNQNKSNLDPDANGIIDPYLIDPELHIYFSGALAIALTSNLGKSTIALLKLDRSELFEMRKEHQEKIGLVLESILNENLPLSARRALYEDLEGSYASPHAQYSAMVKCMLTGIKDKLPNNFFLV